MGSESIQQQIKKKQCFQQILKTNIPQVCHDPTLLKGKSCVRHCQSAVNLVGQSSGKFHFNLVSTNVLL